MNNTHTPGPWTHNADGLVSTGSIMIADCRMAHAFESVGAKTTSEEVANATLIAAAPDLLAALESCEALICDLIDADELGDNQDLVVLVRAAIAKAKGGQ